MLSAKCRVVSMPWPFLNCLLNGSQGELIWVNMTRVHELQSGPDSDPKGAAPGKGHIQTEVPAT